MTARHNVAAPATSQPAPPPADTVEAYGLTCGGLEPLIAQRLRALAPGEVLEIRSDQPEAAGGIDAWVSLTGHSLVAVEHDDSRHIRYYVKKKGAGA